MLQCKPCSEPCLFALPDSFCEQEHFLPLRRITLMDRVIDGQVGRCRQPRLPLNNQKHPQQMKSSQSRANPRNSCQETPPPHSTSSINKTLMRPTHSKLGQRERKQRIRTQTSLPNRSQSSPNEGSLSAAVSTICLHVNVHRHMHMAISSDLSTCIMSDWPGKGIERREGHGI